MVIKPLNLAKSEMGYCQVAGHDPECDNYHACRIREERLSFQTLLEELQGSFILYENEWHDAAYQKKRIEAALVQLREATK